MAVPESEAPLSQPQPTQEPELSPNAERESTAPAKMCQRRRGRPWGAKQTSRSNPQSAVELQELLDIGRRIDGLIAQKLV